MKHKVSELKGALLDAAVAKAEGKHWVIESHADARRSNKSCWVIPAGGNAPVWAEGPFCPSQDWQQGCPIIERHDYLLPYRSPGHRLHFGAYSSQTPGGLEHSGPTPLVAAMRAYVATKLGSEFELP